jgi:hypothetical protein
MVPAKTLPTLPATQHSFSSPRTITASSGNLLIHDRIPIKVNPNQRITRLIPVETRFKLRNIDSSPRPKRERPLGRLLR